MDFVPSKNMGCQLWPAYSSGYCCAAEATASRLPAMGWIFAPYAWIWVSFPSEFPSGTKISQGISPSAQYPATEAPAADAPETETPADDESEDEIYEQVATDYEDDEVIHDEDNESKPQE